MAQANDLWGKKLGLKIQNAAIQLAGITITFAINYGLHNIWKDCMSVALARVSAVLNFFGFFACIFLFVEFRRHLKEIPPEGKFNPIAFPYYVLCPITFLSIIVFWLYLGKVGIIIKFISWFVSSRFGGWLT